jgi:hypothetical protein
MTVPLHRRSKRLKRAKGRQRKRVPIVLGNDISLNETLRHVESTWALQWLMID